MPRRNFRELEARMSPERIEESDARVQKLAPIHPGEILRADFMAEDISIDALARATGMPESDLSLIVNGKLAITEDTAGRLAQFFGTSAQLWLNIQNKYDLDSIDFAKTVRPMKYKGFAGVATFDKDAKVFHGEVLGTRDVITFEGSSVEEIQKAFRESVDDYLAFCADKDWVIRTDAEFDRAVQKMEELDRKESPTPEEKALSERLTRLIEDYDEKVTLTGPDIELTYPAKIFQDPEGKDWVVKFRDLKGATTGGATFDEALEEASDCLASYLARLAAADEPIPDPSKAEPGETLIVLKL